MSKNADWIAPRVDIVREAHPRVTEAIGQRMAELLAGSLSERQLRPGELTETAKLLIRDMVVSDTEPTGEKR